jgi:hypothetical protein
MKNLTPFKAAQLMIKNTNDNHFNAIRIITMIIIPTLATEDEKKYWGKVRQEIANIKHGKTQE